MDELLAKITKFCERSWQGDTYSFCGSLVLVNNESDSRFDIIDGQQRLTTILKFLNNFNITPLFVKKPGDCVNTSWKKKLSL